MMSMLCLASKSWVSIPDGRKGLLGNKNGITKALGRPMSYVGRETFNRPLLHCHLSTLLVLFRPDPSALASYIV